MKLTICYVTSRTDCKFEWFYDSLVSQMRNTDDIQIIVVDTNFPNSPHPECSLPDAGKFPKALIHTLPKPTVWQGKHRLTKEDWWAASNARNTGIVMCDTEWIAFCDDRCVLVPTWLQSIRDAMSGYYAVFGSYEKRWGMEVEKGIITTPGELKGEDNRAAIAQRELYPASGWWCYGCTLALPLDWCCQVNGFNELLDGLSAEDTNFGCMLENNGYTMKYDPRMKIIEDRTPSVAKQVMRRESKERFPHDTQDKGHEAVRRFNRLSCSPHQWNICDLRIQYFKDGTFPIPTGPTHDWYDNQPLAEM